MRAPAQLKAAVKDYYENPEKYVDFTNLRHYGGNQYIVEIKPLKEVLGLEFLGKGNFSSVFALNDTRVLKIVCNQTEDESYKAFAQFCKTDTSGYFPTVHYSGNWGGRDVYILEKLETFSDVDGSMVASFVCDTFRALAACERKKQGKLERWESADEIEYPKPSSFVPAFNSELIKALENLAQFFELSKNNGINCSADIHSGNVMSRNGHIVITDPFS